MSDTVYLYACIGTSGNVAVSPQDNPLRILNVETGEAFNFAYSSDQDHEPCNPKMFEKIGEIPTKDALMLVGLRHGQGMFCVAFNAGGTQPTTHELDDLSKRFGGNKMQLIMSEIQNAGGQIMMNGRNILRQTTTPNTSYTKNATIAVLKPKS